MGTNVSFGWRPDLLELEGTSSSDDSAIEVADSWLVDDGRTRALDLHRARFAASIPAPARAELRLDAFWMAALALIPRTGRFFPRVELTAPGGTRRLAFRLRSAPPVSTSVTAITHLGADLRSRPTVKGPDLAALAAVRRQAQRSGAEEAVITTADGFVVEGTTTGLLWWRDFHPVRAPAGIERVGQYHRKIRHHAGHRPRHPDALRSRQTAGPGGIGGVGGERAARYPRHHGLDRWAAPLPAPQRLATWSTRLDALTQPLVSSSP